MLKNFMFLIGVVCVCYFFVGLRGEQVVCSDCHQLQQFLK